MEYKIYNRYVKKSGRWHGRKFLEGKITAKNKAEALKKAKAQARKMDRSVMTGKYKGFKTKVIEVKPHKPVKRKRKKRPRTVGLFGW